jgi:hypothetical protein
MMFTKYMRDLAELHNKCARDLAELWEFGVRLHPRRVLAYVTWMVAELGQLRGPMASGLPRARTTSPQWPGKEIN